MMEIQNFIRGEFVRCEDLIDSYDPSTGEVWAKIPNTPKEQVCVAVQAAKDAFPVWSKTTVKERSVILHRIADLLEARLQEFAEHESRDQGKPVWLAQAVDIPRAVHNFRFFASSILHHVEKSEYQAEFKSLNYTSRMPVGVCGLISPWNLPIYLLTFKIAPALACGNTVVCKPSEMTSVTAHMLCTVCKDAGLPDGVLNMTFGTGPVTGDALIRHPDVNAISFTGSTATAERIRNACAPYTKKLSLELGGKNAAIIFADCDLDKCVDVTTRSSFINQGEICLCTSRIFVQREIYQQFLQRFVASARKMRVGDPKDKNSKLGALISKEHLAKVTSYGSLAQRMGATIHCGYGVDDVVATLPDKNKQGYFFPPTIVTDVSDDSALMQEEIFGPMTCVVPFDSEDEVIKRANDVPYGLCATIWSQNINTANRVARQLQVGYAWVNCWLVRSLNMPFGGMKASGIGREGTEDSLEFFTEVKTICVQTD